jgi:tetratricopeptide (TPR) repeat protein
LSQVLFAVILSSAFFFKTLGDNPDSISVYLQQLDFENARKIAEQQVKLNKYSHYSWFQLGEVYSLISKELKQNNLTDKSDSMMTSSCNCYIKAVNLYFKSGKINPTYVNRLERCHANILNSGNGYFLNHQYDKAYQCYDLTIEITSIISRMNRAIKFDTISIFYQALTLEKNGNIEAAKKNYLKLMSMNYQNPDLYINLASIFNTGKNYNNAIAIIRKGLKLFSTNKTLLIDYGRTSILAGRQQETIADLKEKTDRIKNNADLFFVIATLYDNINASSEAEVFYKKCIETDPKYLEASYNLGVMYYNLAIEKNKILNELNRNDDAFLQILSERNMLFKKAEPFFKKSVDLNPKEVQKILKNISQALS